MITYVGIGILIILVLFIIYSWDTTKSAEYMTNKGDIQPYDLTHVDIAVEPNHMNERVLSINNRGGMNQTEVDMNIHASGKKCLPPATQIPGTSTCECPVGMTYSNMFGCLSECPPFQRMDAEGNCQNICEDPNTYYDSYTSNCEYCPPGYQADANNVCQPLPNCPPGQYYTDNTGVCGSCPDGQTFDATLNQCMDYCLHFQDYEPTSQTCQNKCSDTQYYDSDAGCTECPIGYISDGNNRCILSAVCPPGQTFDAQSNCVDRCLFYEEYNPVGDVCAPRCQVENANGAFTQYYDIYTDNCVVCPGGQISDGSNGCIPGPTAPAPTCPPGYRMEHGECIKPCAPWRYYDANTDSCLLECPDKSSFFDTNIHQCVRCPPGTMVDSNNKCSQTVPTRPVIHTVAPTCAPGFNATDAGCLSYCPAYLYNDPNDTLDCIPRCPLESQYWDVKNNGCANCTNGYIKDDTNNCSVCADGYSLNIHGHCVPTSCPLGYLINNHPDDPSYNTCSVCDQTNMTGAFSVTGYTSIQGQCVPKCEVGYDFNPEKNDCSICADNYQFAADHRHCEPKTCPPGYLVDVTNFKCDVCDTNNINKNIGVASYANEDGKCVPICKTGYVMNTNDPTKNNCGMCAVGYSFNSNGFCVPSSCPAGYVVNSTTNACTDCADGYTKNHMGLCAPTCTTGYALNTVTNKCDICATGYSLDNHGNCVPNACPTGYVFNADTNACTDCAPSYNKGADGKCSPVCTDPAYTVNPKTNDCTACSTGYSLYTDGVHCVPDCPAGYIVNTRDKYQCTACDTAAGYISDGSKNCIKPNIDGVYISVEIATEDLPNYNPNKPYIPLEPTLSDLVTNGFSINIAVDVSAGGYNTGVVTCNGTKYNLPPNSSRSGNPVMFTNITLTTGSEIAVNVTLYDANQKVLSSVDKIMKLTSHVYTNDVAGQALPEGAFYAIGVAIGAGGGGAGAGSLNS